MKKIIFINLGGPRTTEEIHPFLDDLFSDPYVFDLPLPEFFRIRLAKFIAKKRAPKVAKAYESMGYGGGSPLYSESIKQADAIIKRLSELGEPDWNYEIAMTCGPPNIRNMNPENLKPGNNILIAPLYPHFSRSTTMSTNKIIESIIGYCPANPSNIPCGNSCEKTCLSTKIIPSSWLSPFYNDPGFVEATSKLIIDYLSGKLNYGEFIHSKNPEITDWKKTPILFSAHGIPMRLVKKGDIYPAQIEESIQLIDKFLKTNGHTGEIYLSYQSKVGPAKWTEPSTIKKIEELGSRGVEELAIYPISFINDHLETLEEIGEQLKEVAHKSGIKKYYRIPAPGTFPSFIDFLAKRILATISK